MAPAECGYCSGYRADRDAAIHASKSRPGRGVAMLLQVQNAIVDKSGSALWFKQTLSRIVVWRLLRNCSSRLDSGWLWSGSRGDSISSLTG
jgi:hypothetical protein